MNAIVTAADVARAALAAHEGGPAVAVVIRLDGPETGRRLLLLETGEIRGTLGSEALDARALELACEALDGAGPRVETIESGETADAASSGPAGTDTAGEEPAHGPGGRSTPGPPGRRVATGTRVRLYVEAHRAPDELVIVGAGHIAVPVSKLGVMLGYRVIVLDDREALATAERFPGAAEVRRMEFHDPFRGLTIGPRTHILLVTRAHRYDFDCLHQLLLRSDVSPAYIGMIGSRRRIRAAFLALLEAGVPREKLAAISAPVGLDIGAETPEEIAVAIAAELVALRRAGTAAGARTTTGPREGARAGAGEADIGTEAIGARDSATGPGSFSTHAVDLVVDGLLDRRGEGRRVGRIAAKERVLDRWLSKERGDG